MSSGGRSCRSDARAYGVWRGARRAGWLAWVYNGSQWVQLLWRQLVRDKPPEFWAELVFSCTMRIRVLAFLTPQAECQVKRGRR